MKYRKLDANGDRVFGGSMRDFWIDVPDAPAQAVKTRLAMFQGDWFIDLDDGTPWRTEVLGKYTGNTRDPVVRERILETQGVTEILSYSSDTNRDTRKFEIDAKIDTIYGAGLISGPF